MAKMANETFVFVFTGPNTGQKLVNKKKKTKSELVNNKRLNEKETFGCCIAENKTHFFVQLLPLRNI